MHVTIPTSEDALPLVEAVHKGTGLRPHLSTVQRWCQRRNRFGNRLESWIIGGRRYTSVEAVHRYNAANTLAAERRDGLITPSSTTTQRTKAHSDAMRELDREFA